MFLPVRAASLLTAPTHHMAQGVSFHLVATPTKITLCRGRVLAGMGLVKGTLSATQFIVAGSAGR